jgi:hypothetical protein
LKRIHARQASHARLIEFDGFCSLVACVFEIEQFLPLSK